MRVEHSLLRVEMHLAGRRGAVRTGSLQKGEGASAAREGAARAPRAKRTRLVAVLVAEVAGSRLAMHPPLAAHHLVGTARQRQQVERKSLAGAKEAARCAAPPHVGSRGHVGLCLSGGGGAPGRTGATESLAEAQAAPLHPLRAPRPRSPARVRGAFACSRTRKRSSRARRSRSPPRREHAAQRPPEHEGQRGAQGSGVRIG